MANHFKYANLRSNASTTSRYFLSGIIYYNDKVAFSTYKRKAHTPEANSTRYEISKDNEFRPDKVSIKFYGVPDFWWKIMETNRMKDILEFRAGRNILLPGGSVMF